ncbi:MAG: glycosyltransferase family 4 protein [Planctomycetes bacterium]|nr:glycosyltransferase family 4 protein [Planctomycetota bacterium]
MRLPVTTTTPRNARAATEAPMVLHARVVAGSGGGPEKTILRSARYTDAGRLRVGAAYIHPHDDPAFDTVRRQAREQGCPLWEIGESGPVDPRTLTSMLRLCRQLGVSVWHGHDYKSNLMGLILSRLHPMRLVTTVHGWTDESRRTRLYRRVDAFCLPRYERVIAVSRALEAECLKLGVARHRLTHIANGIETGIYRRRRTTAEARASLGLNPRVAAIGVVGRLSKEKGVDRALRAFAAVHAQLPGAELHMIGDGPERGAIGSLARQLNIDGSVRIWGWLADTRPMYEAMDMLLLPSRTEGTPNAVLEAMAMETPVAATDVGGLRELLDGGSCGVILDGDESRWHAPIAELLSDPAARQRLARAARRRIEMRYTFEVRMAKEMSVYENLIALPPAGRTTEPAPLRRAA